MTMMTAAAAKDFAAYPGHDREGVEDFYSGIAKKYGVRVADYFGPDQRLQMTKEGVEQKLKQEAEATVETPKAKTPKKKS